MRRDDSDVGQDGILRPVGNRPNEVNPIGIWLRLLRLPTNLFAGNGKLILRLGLLCASAGLLPITRVNLANLPMSRGAARSRIRAHHVRKGYIFSRPIAPSVARVIRM